MHVFYDFVTDRARHSLELANNFAYNNYHPLVTNLHILWGLLEEGANIANKVLKDMKVDIVALQKQIVNFLGKGDYKSHKQAVCYAEDAIQVICEAILQGMPNQAIGCHHLLRGILANPYNLATRLLDQYKVTAELVDAHMGAIVKK